MHCLKSDRGGERRAPAGRAGLRRHCAGEGLGREEDVGVEDLVDIDGEAELPVVVLTGGEMHTRSREYIGVGGEIVNGIFLEARRIFKEMGTLLITGTKCTSSEFGVSSSADSFRASV